MAHLTVAGVSADGRRLLLVSDQGAEHTLEITPALRAALRGETTRIGQLEIQMTSTLRPREIQTRIRAGESPEAVAEAARTTVEAIMPFVAPVLAEREHVAQRAQASSVRRQGGEGGGSPRALGDAVATQLRSQDARPDRVEWDAYRREDGRWALTAAFETTRRSGTARFAYDPPGSYVVAENDDARWLVGDVAPQAAQAAPATLDDLHRARQRRLAATAGADELPLGDDALDLVAGEAADATVEPPATYDEPAHDPAPAEPAAAATPEAVDEPDEPARQRRPVQKKRGRASVPSWDEIMFGGGDQ